jgi:hypothetical protein
MNIKTLKEDKKQLVEQVMSSISYLHLEYIDSELNSFINNNFKFFFECMNADISYANTNGFKIINKDGSEYKITMIPDSVKPEKIIVELVNLNGNSIQSYTINYLTNNVINVIKRTSLKTNDLKGNERLQKSHIEKVYKNDKLYREKKLDNYVSDTDNNCSRETVTYYPNLDDTYVKSQISIGMDDSIYPTSIRYIKYDGKNVKSISPSEYRLSTNLLRKDKVLSICKKCA